MAVIAFLGGLPRGIAKGGPAWAEVSAGPKITGLESGRERQKATPGELLDLLVKQADEAIHTSTHAGPNRATASAHDILFDNNSYFWGIATRGKMNCTVKALINV